MIRLDKIATIQAGIVTKTKNAGEFHGVRVLTMASLAEMRAGALSIDNLPAMDVDDSMHDKRYQLRLGDVMIPSRTTEEYLEPAIVSDPLIVDLPFNATLLCVRACINEVDPWWLYGYLGSEVGKARMLQASQSGTAQLSLGAKTIGKIKIELPSLEIQQRVGRLIQCAHDAKRNAVHAADLRLKLAYAVAFQPREETSSYKNRL